MAIRLLCSLSYLGLLGLRPHALRLDELRNLSSDRSGESFRKIMEAFKIVNKNFPTQLSFLKTWGDALRDFSPCALPLATYGFADSFS